MPFYYICEFYLAPAASRYSFISFIHLENVYILCLLFLCLRLLFLQETLRAGQDSNYVPNYF